MWKALLSIFKATASPYGTIVRIRKVPFLKTLCFHLLRNVIINIQSDSVAIVMVPIMLCMAVKPQWPCLCYKKLTLLAGGCFVNPRSTDVLQ